MNEILIYIESNGCLLRGKVAQIPQEGDHFILLDLVEFFPDAVEGAECSQELAESYIGEEFIVSIIAEDPTLSQESNEQCWCCEVFAS